MKSKQRLVKQNTSKKLLNRNFSAEKYKQLFKEYIKYKKSLFENMQTFKEFKNYINPTTPKKNINSYNFFSSPDKKQSSISNLKKSNQKQKSKKILSPSKQNFLDLQNINEDFLFLLKGSVLIIEDWWKKIINKLKKENKMLSPQKKRNKNIKFFSPLSLITNKEFIKNMPMLNSLLSMSLSQEKKHKKYLKKSNKNNQLSEFLENYNYSKKNNLEPKNFEITFGPMSKSLATKKLKKTSSCDDVTEKNDLVPNEKFFINYVNNIFIGPDVPKNVYLNGKDVSIIDASVQVSNLSISSKNSKINKESSMKMIDNNESIKLENISKNNSSLNIKEIISNNVYNNSFKINKSVPEIKNKEEINKNNNNTVLLKNINNINNINIKNLIENKNNENIENEISKNNDENIFEDSKNNKNISENYTYVNEEEVIKQNKEMNDLTQKNSLNIEKKENLNENRISLDNNSDKNVIDNNISNSCHSISSKNKSDKTNNKNSKLLNNNNNSRINQTHPLMKGNQNNNINDKSMNNNNKKNAFLSKSKLDNFKKNENNKSSDILKPNEKNNMITKKISNETYDMIHNKNNSLIHSYNNKSISDNKIKTIELIADTNYENMLPRSDNKLLQKMESDKINSLNINKTKKNKKKSLDSINNLNSPKSKINSFKLSYNKSNSNIITNNRNCGNNLLKIKIKSGYKSTSTTKNGNDIQLNQKQKQKRTSYTKKIEKKGEKIQKQKANEIIDILINNKTNNKRLSINNNNKNLKKKSNSTTYLLKKKKQPQKIINISSNKDANNFIDDSNYNQNNGFYSDNTNNIVANSRLNNNIGRISISGIGLEINSNDETLLNIDRDNKYEITSQRNSDRSIDFNLSSISNKTAFITQGKYNINEQNNINKIIFKTHTNYLKRHKKNMTKKFILNNEEKIYLDKETMNSAMNIFKYTELDKKSPTKNKIKLNIKNNICLGNKNDEVKKEIKSENINLLLKNKTLPETKEKKNEIEKNKSAVINENEKLDNYEGLRMNNDDNLKNTENINFNINISTEKEEIINKNTDIIEEKNNLLINEEINNDKNINKSFNLNNKIQVDLSRLSENSEKNKTFDKQISTYENKFKNFKQKNANNNPINNLFENDIINTDVNKKYDENLSHEDDKNLHIKTENENLQLEKFKEKITNDNEIKKEKSDEEKKNSTINITIPEMAEIKNDIEKNKFAIMNENINVNININEDNLNNYLNRTFKTSPEINNKINDELNPVNNQFILINKTFEKVKNKEILNEDKNNEDDFIENKEKDIATENKNVNLSSHQEENKDEVNENISGIIVEKISNKSFKEFNELINEIKKEENISEFHKNEKINEKSGNFILNKTAPEIVENKNSNESNNKSVIINRKINLKKNEEVSKQNESKDIIKNLNSHSFNENNKSIHESNKENKLKTEIIENDEINKTFNIKNKLNDFSESYKENLKNKSFTNMNINILEKQEKELGISYNEKSETNPNNNFVNDSFKENNEEKCNSINNKNIEILKKSNNINGEEKVNSSFQNKYIKEEISNIDGRHKSVVLNKINNIENFNFINKNKEKNKEQEIIKENEMVDHENKENIEIKESNENQEQKEEEKSSENKEEIISALDQTFKTSSKINDNYHIQLNNEDKKYDKLNKTFELSHDNNKFKSNQKNEEISLKNNESNNISSISNLGVVIGYKIENININSINGNFILLKSEETSIKPQSNEIEKQISNGSINKINDLNYTNINNSNIYINLNKTNPEIREKKQNENDLLNKTFDYKNYKYDLSKFNIEGNNFIFLKNEKINDINKEDPIKNNENNDSETNKILSPESNTQKMRNLLNIGINLLKKSAIPSLIIPLSNKFVILKENKDEDKDESKIEYINESNQKEEIKKANESQEMNKTDLEIKQNDNKIENNKSAFINQDIYINLDQLNIKNDESRKMNKTFDKKTKENDIIINYNMINSKNKDNTHKKEEKEEEIISISLISIDKDELINAKNIIHNENPLGDKSLDKINEPKPEKEQKIIENVDNKIIDNSNKSVITNKINQSFLVLTKNKKINDKQNKSAILRQIIINNKNDDKSNNKENIKFNSDNNLLIIQKIIDGLNESNEIHLLNNEIDNKNEINNINKTFEQKIKNNLSQINQGEKEKSFISENIKNLNKSSKQINDNIINSNNNDIKFLENIENKNKSEKNESNTDRLNDENKIKLIQKISQEYDINIKNKYKRKSEINSLSNYDLFNSANNKILIKYKENKNELINSDNKKNINKSKLIENLEETNKICNEGNELRNNLFPQINENKNMEETENEWVILKTNKKIEHFENSGINNIDINDNNFINDDIDKTVNEFVDNIFNLNLNKNTIVNKEFNDNKNSDMNILKSDQKDEINFLNQNNNKEEKNSKNNTEIKDKLLSENNINNNNIFSNEAVLTNKSEEYIPKSENISINRVLKHILNSSDQVSENSNINKSLNNIENSVSNIELNESNKKHFIDEKNLNSNVIQNDNSNILNKTVPFVKEYNKANENLNKTVMIKNNSNIKKNYEQTKSNDVTRKIHNFDNHMLNDFIARLNEQDKLNNSENGFPKNRSLENCPNIEISEMNKNVFTTEIENNPIVEAKNVCNNNAAYKDKNYKNIKSENISQNNSLIKDSIEKNEKDKLNISERIKNNNINKINEFVELNEDKNKIIRNENSIPEDNKITNKYKIDDQQKGQEKTNNNVNLSKEVNKNNENEDIKLNPSKVENTKKNNTFSKHFKQVTQSICPIKKRKEGENINNVNESTSLIIQSLIEQDNINDDKSTQKINEVFQFNTDNNNFSVDSRIKPINSMILPSKNNQSKIKNTQNYNSSDIKSFHEININSENNKETIENMDSVIENNTQTEDKKETINKDDKEINIIEKNKKINDLLEIFNDKKSNIEQESLETIKKNISLNNQNNINNIKENSPHRITSDGNSEITPQKQESYILSLGKNFKNLYNNNKQNVDDNLNNNKIFNTEHLNNKNVLTNIEISKQYKITDIRKNHHKITDNNINNENSKKTEVDELLEISSNLGNDKNKTTIENKDIFSRNKESIPNYEFQTDDLPEFNKLNYTK